MFVFVRASSKETRKKELLSKMIERIEREERRELTRREKTRGKKGKRRRGQTTG